MFNDEKTQEKLEFMMQNVPGIEKIAQNLSEDDWDFTQEIGGDIIGYLQYLYYYVDIRTITFALFAVMVGFLDVLDECGGNLNDVIKYANNNDNVKSAEIIDFKNLGKK